MLQKEQKLWVRFRLRLSLRLLWELGLPILFFAGVPLILHLSWRIFLALLLFDIPDLGRWLLTMMCLLLLTSLSRIFILLAFKLIKKNPGGLLISLDHESVEPF